MPPTGPPPYLWGVKPENQQFPRKRKAPLLEEMLVTFPDPKNLTRTGNKYEEIVEGMRERHKEQRQRLLDRHMKEFNKWKEDTNKSIDFDTSFKFYFPLTRPGAIMLSESVKLISKPEASAALQRLPASRRNVTISIEQLKMPPNLSEKDEYRYKELSHPEIAAEIAKQGVIMRNRMRKEEQEMRVYQNEALSIFLQALERNYPDKYGKNGSNSQKAASTSHAQGPSFGSFVPRDDATSRGVDPRRPPALVSVQKTPNMLSASNTPKTAIFTPIDKDTEMRDAVQASQTTAGQIPTAPAPAQPGVSRDPRKPPPSFNPYIMREDLSSSSLPPNLNKAREERLSHYSRHEEHLPQLPPTGPSNLYGRREPREDPYSSRRENIQPQKAVAYSTMFKSPISPSLHETTNQSPASPSGEHIGGHRMSRQGSDRSAKQSPVIGKDGVTGTSSGWGASPRNADAIDPGEAAYIRRMSMSGNMGGR